jgi:flagellin
LNITNKKLGRALEKLSSGLRINRVADDAAGLAISEKMRTQIRGMRLAARNGQDAISMVQIAEGALNEVHGILQRMRGLTVQAGNSTLSNSDRISIGEEMLTLKNEIDNIASRTTFNGLSLLTGSLSTSQSGGTATVGLAMNTTTTSSLSQVKVTGLVLRRDR